MSVSNLTASPRKTKEVMNAAQNRGVSSSFTSRRLAGRGGYAGRPLGRPRSDRPFASNTPGPRCQSSAFSSKSVLRGAFVFGAETGSDTDTDSGSSLMSQPAYEVKVRWLIILFGPSNPTIGLLPLPMFPFEPQIILTPWSYASA